MGIVPRVGRGSWEMWYVGGIAVRRVSCAPLARDAPPSLPPSPHGLRHCYGMASPGSRAPSTQGRPSPRRPRRGTQLDDTEESGSGLPARPRAPLRATL